MIFLFIHFTICKEIFDFTYSYKKNPSFIAYMEPFDELDFIIKANVYFSDLSKFDYLTYEFEINNKGNITKYGPFDKSSYISGVIYEKGNLTIHFRNEGPDSIKFAVITYDFKNIYPEFDFPITDYKWNDFIIKNDPFLYNVGRQYHYAIFIIMGIFILLYIIIYLSCCDKECWLCLTSCGF